jgi:hypothetical protein
VFSQISTWCDPRHASIAAAQINVNALVFDDGQSGCRMIEESTARGGFPTMRTWQEPAVRNPGGGTGHGDDARPGARPQRIQGRKRLLRAQLNHGDILCAEAEGLFIELRPDQP